MTKSKSTKKALLLSMLSVLVCVAMLVGSTFAWFTDSVSTGKNKIVAGNLDVGLQYKTGAEEYADVTSTTNLFKTETLWEPGHVEYVNLKVSNLGTLALKYAFDVTVANEVSSVNVYGKDFKLSDYIYFAVVDGAATYADNAEAIAAAEEAGAAKISELAVAQSDLVLKAKESKEITIVAYMPESVSNEANYKVGEARPEIDLGLTLVATQTPFEEDSFGKDYDKDAPRQAANDADSLDAILSNGGYAVLEADITRNQVFEVNGNATLDLNGHTLKSLDGGPDNWMAIRVKEGQKLTLKDSSEDGSGKVVASCYGIYVQPGATFIMDGGTIEVAGNGTYDYGVTTWGSTFVMNGGTIDAAGVGVCAFTHPKYPDNKNLITLKDAKITATSWEGVYIENTEGNDVNLINCEVSGGTVALSIVANNSNIFVDGGTYTGAKAIDVNGNAKLNLINNPVVTDNE